MATRGNKAELEADIFSLIAVFKVHADPVYWGRVEHISLGQWQALLDLADYEWVEEAMRTLARRFNEYPKVMPTGSHNTFLYLEGILKRQPLS
jgi:hypothetical protein